GGHKRRIRTGIRYVNGFCVVSGRNVMGTEMLEVSLLGVGTVLRLERDAWSMVKRPRQATNEHAPPPIYLQICKFPDVLSLFRFRTEIYPINPLAHSTQPNLILPTKPANPTSQKQYVQAERHRPTHTPN
ncbi:unnamed protein product, partial [Sphacelaria rigidula]